MKPAIPGNSFGTENGRVARSAIRLAKAIIRNAAADYAACWQRRSDARYAERLAGLQREIRKVGADLQYLHRMLPAIDDLDRREAAQQVAA